LTLKEYEAIDFRPSLTLVPPAAYLGKLNPVNASHPTGDTYSRVNRHASPLDNPFMPISFSSWCLRLFFVAVNNWFSLLAYVAPLGFFFFFPKKKNHGCNKHMHCDYSSLRCQLLFGLITNKSRKSDMNAVAGRSTTRAQNWSPSVISSR